MIDLQLKLRELIKKHLLAGSARMEYELAELHRLLTMAKESFKKTKTLIEVPCPVNICGDIHGQYGDLMRIFQVLFASLVYTSFKYIFTFRFLKLQSMFSYVLRRY